MEQVNNQIETLNDLVLINNDRVEGYQKAIEELKPEDGDLRLDFQERIDQSKSFHSELVSEIAKTGGEVEQGTKLSGKIYRAWMDVKAFFSGADRKAILDNCEDGEDAALSAYDAALESVDLTPEQRSILIRHHAGIKASHDRIKAMRDAL
jgi:uncharacterized protein (TIGR02284 family)